MHRRVHQRPTDQMQGVWDDFVGGAKKVFTGAAAPTVSPALRRDLGTATLRRGSRGAAVFALQKLLNAHRVPTGVDGAFGRTTHAAVVAFQRKTFPKNPGEWDGVVGRNTRMALMGRAVAPAALSNRRSVPASQVRRRPAAAASSHAAAMPGLPPMKKKMPTWVWIAGAAGAGLLLFLALSPRGRKGARRVAVAGRQAGQGAYNRGRQQVQRLRQRALPPPEAY